MRKNALNNNFSKTSESVIGEVNYLIKGETSPSFYAYDSSKDHMPLEPHSVNIYDARQLIEKPCLDREGFTLVRSPSKVTDFYDFDEVNTIYATELESILRKVTGASKLVVTTIGNPRKSKLNKNAAASVERPIHFVHADFSDESAWWWASMIMDQEEFETVKGKRLAIYSTWRSIAPPPQDVPLAICDARTTPKKNSVIADAVADHPETDDVHWEALLYTFSPSHKWYYFPNLVNEEIIIFKAFDSDNNKASRCAHTAFQDKTCPSNAAERISVDTRIFAFFD